ncbi:substrate-binding periplasmic protein [Undibacterium terreum]|nr:transporter substrate-binding domain-containing protein [Undibacterium terreum]
MPLLLFVVPALSATLQIAATGSPAGDMMTKEVLNYAYARLGVQVNFVDVPMRRGFAEVQAGTMDGITASGIAAIEKMVKVSVPVTYNDIAVFSVRQQFRVTGYESLRPYSIGMIAGIKYLEERLNGMKLDKAPNVDSLFQKLAAGRTDIVVDALTDYCSARKLGLTEIRILEPVLERRLAHHFLGERHTALARELETVLAAMEKDGTLKKIQERAEKKYQEQCNSP